MTIRFLFGLGFVALTSLTTLGGCGGRAVTSSSCGQTPEDTIELREEWKAVVKKANADHTTCSKPYDDAVEECINDTGDQEGCVSPFIPKYAACLYAYDKAINGPTEERCGVQVYVVPEGIDPEEYEYNVSTGDFDGDGLTDFEEFQIESDPCTYNSIDPCTSDGKLDADGDGILNAEDPAPFCPGEVAAACV